MKYIARAILYILSIPVFFVVVSLLFLGTGAIAGLFLYFAADIDRPFLAVSAMLVCEFVWIFIVVM